MKYWKSVIIIIIFWFITIINVSTFRKYYPYNMLFWIVWIIGYICFIKNQINIKKVENEKC